MNTMTLPIVYDESDTLIVESPKPTDYYVKYEVPEENHISETQSPANDESTVSHLPAERVQRSFLPDVSWEGMVLDVSEGSFIARLVDMNDSSQFEEAEIKNSAVSDQDDIALIKPGAIFFWSIGTRIEGRRSEQVSLIQFRRLPVWTKSEIQQSKQEAAEIYKKLSW